jgi:general secretion pathway protein J
MTRGLTLIELVVAMAVFALVAVMGLQSLSGSLRLRDVLVTRADAAADLARAVTLLRNDFSAAAPMAFYGPDEAPARSALRADDDGQGFALSLLGQPGLRDSAGRVDAASWQRVEWRVVEGRLLRRAWSTLYPQTETQRSPDMPVLEGVNAMGLRSYWAGRGWIPGLTQILLEDAGGQDGERDGDRATAPEVYSNSLPLAMEVTLETTAYGRITLVEYFQ